MSSNQPPKSKREIKFFNEESLLNFYNLNCNNHKEVEEFCEKYVAHQGLNLKSTVEFDHMVITQLIPHVIEEAKLFQEIAEHIINNKTTERDLYEINKRTVGIQRQIVFTDLDEVNHINSHLGFEPHSFEKLENPVFDLQKNYPDQLSPFWEKLVSTTIQRQLVKKCWNCGRFFMPSKVRKDNRFCSRTCDSAYSKRVKRATQQTLS